MTSASRISSSPSAEATTLTATGLSNPSGTTSAIRLRKARSLALVGLRTTKTRVCSRRSKGAISPGERRGQAAGDDESRDGRTSVPFGLSARAEDDQLLRFWVGEHARREGGSGTLSRLRVSIGRAKGRPDAPGADGGQRGSVDDGVDDASLLVEDHRCRGQAGRLDMFRSVRQRRTDDLDGGHRFLPWTSTGRGAPKRRRTCPTMRAGMTSILWLVICSDVRSGIWTRGGSSASPGRGGDDSVRNNRADMSICWPSAEPSTEDGTRADKSVWRELRRQAGDILGGEDAHLGRRRSTKGEGKASRKLSRTTPVFSAYNARTIMRRPGSRRSEW